MHARLVHIIMHIDISMDHDDIEKFVTKQKAHRGADRQDAKWQEQKEQYWSYEYLACLPVCLSACHLPPACLRITGLHARLCQRV